MKSSFNLAREHYEQACREFADECESMDKLRLLVFEAKFAFVDHDYVTAVEILAGQTDAGCVSTRLAMLLERGEFDRAADTVNGLDAHEKWAANGIVALLYEGKDNEAGAILEWARSALVTVTLHQCLFATASSLFQREVVDRFAQVRLSPVLIGDAARSQLERVLEGIWEDNWPGIVVRDADEYRYISRQNCVLEDFIRFCGRMQFPGRLEIPCN